MTEFLTKAERNRVDSYLRVGEDMIYGSVKVNRELCTGCQFCTKACFPGALEVVDKKCRMVLDNPQCIACGNCVAICPENAIEIVRYIEFKYLYRFLDRGEPAGPRRF